MKPQKSVINTDIYYNNFEITGGPCNLTGSNCCDLLTNCTIFCFKSHLFPSQWGGYTKNKTTHQISRLVLSNSQITGKWKTKSVMWQILQLLFPNLLFPPPPPKKKLISDQLSTASIKYLNWPGPVFGRFQNGCSKVVIEPRVMQFWCEIILVISNRTRVARSFDFEITRMISAQTALH